MQMLVIRCLRSNALHPVADCFHAKPVYQPLMMDLSEDQLVQGFYELSKPCMLHHRGNTQRRRQPSQFPNQVLTHLKL